VCVTPVEALDRAVAIAALPGVIFCSFGDMLRVPGSERDLFAIKAAGGDVRVVYSPMDAVGIAARHPEREVVFFAVGFETTAPANAMSVKRAKQLGLTNFSVLASHVLVPPAMEAILSSPLNRVQGFLLAGHVCTVMGWTEYEPLGARFRIPMIVTGFEPLDLLQGIYMAVDALESGRTGVENQYVRTVSREGNPAARAVVNEVFETCDRAWRGIGVIPKSGYRLRPELAAYDATLKFEVGAITTEEPKECIAGEIMQGLKRPVACSAFGTRCTPEHPLGAPMVSSEGACAAYWLYARA
jgi:hydrogenase expression/formation protein HypD